MPPHRPTQDGHPSPESPSLVERIRSRLTIFDLFGSFNAVLFVILASTSYWHRFLQYKTRANLSEFMVYASAFFVAILVAWVLLRRLRISPLVLVLFELGILIHFAAGLISPGGRRLYDVELGIMFFDYPLRFDKVVHFFNAFVGCAVTLELLCLLKARIPRVLILMVCLIVLGAGAVIEIIEYVVVKTIPHNGVGDYDNNLTDLLANLVGCLTFVVARQITTWRGRRNRFFGLPDGP